MKTQPRFNISNTEEEIIADDRKENQGAVSGLRSTGPGRRGGDNKVGSDMLDTKIGQSKKNDPVDGKGRLRGDAERRGRRSYWFQEQSNDRRSFFTPSDTLAEQHRKKAEPGSANN